MFTPRPLFPLPLELPGDTVCLQLQIPNDPYYWQLLAGQLTALALWSNYDRDTAHTGRLVAALWKKVLASIELCPPQTPAQFIGGFDAEDFMQWRQVGCLLQISVANDPTTGLPCWCTVYDGSLCTSNPAPGGGVTPPSAGTCEAINLNFFANALVPLPFLVNSGDTIQILKLQGAGTDGTTDWYCPDGEYFIASACLGGQHNVSTDPIPTSPHMSVVLKIGSNYYSFFTGTFTVPSGVVNSQIFISVNDSSLSDNNGTYAIDLNYCNNAAPPATTWCKVFDFTLSPAGFSSFAINDANGQLMTPAVWQAGVGWVAQNCIPPPSTTYEWYFGISLDMGAAFAGAGWVVDVIGQMGIHQVTDFFDVGLDAAATGDTFSGASVSLAQPAGNSPFNLTGTLAGAAARYLKVRYIQYSISAPTTPAFVLKSLQIKGSGVNPFGSSNC